MKFEDFFSEKVQNIVDQKHKEHTRYTREHSRHISKRIDSLESKVSSILNAKFEKEEDLFSDLEQEETVRVHCFLTTRQKEWLRTKAFEKGMNMSQVLRLLLEKEIRKTDT